MVPNTCHEYGSNFLSEFQVPSKGDPRFLRFQQSWRLFVLTSPSKLGFQVVVMLLEGDACAISTLLGTKRIWASAIRSRLGYRQKVISFSCLSASICLWFEIRPSPW